MATYAYQTLYGTEPYKANGVPAADKFGGGATITNQNLLITLWNVTGFDLDGLPNAGGLMKPFAFTAEGQAAINGAAADGVLHEERGFAPAFNSRYSCRFLVEDAEETEGVFYLSETLLAILQPPQDLANTLLNVVRDIVPIPASFYGFGFEFLASFWNTLVWNFNVTDQLYRPVPQLTAETAIFGGVGFDTTPVCSTNGADGNFPQFYSPGTVDFADMLEALISGGPVYIPCIFTRQTSFETTLQEIYTISWPGSHARR